MPRITFDNIIDHRVRPAPAMKFPARLPPMQTMKFPGGDNPAVDSVLKGFFRQHEIQAGRRTAIKALTADLTPPVAVLPYWLATVRKTPGHTERSRCDVRWWHWWDASLTEKDRDIVCRILLEEINDDGPTTLEVWNGTAQLDSLDRGRHFIKEVDDISKRYERAKDDALRQLGFEITDDEWAEAEELQRRIVAVAAGRIVKECEDEAITE